jgi:hypothetical protein
MAALRLTDYSAAVHAGGRAHAWMAAIGAADVRPETAVVCPLVSAWCPR